MRNVYRRSARISISINKHNSALISINKHHWTSISTINIYQHHSAWMKIHRPDSALIRVIPLSLECKKSEAEEHHLWGTVGEWSRSGRGRAIYTERLCPYLIFVISFTQAKFSENEIYTEKRVNYKTGFRDKIA